MNGNVYISIPSNSKYWTKCFFLPINFCAFSLLLCRRIIIPHANFPAPLFPLLYLPDIFLRGRIQQRSIKHGFLPVFPVNPPHNPAGASNIGTIVLAYSHYYFIICSVVVFSPFKLGKRFFTNKKEALGFLETRLFGCCLVIWGLGVGWLPHTPGFGIKSGGAVRRAALLQSRNRK